MRTTLRVMAVLAIANAQACECNRIDPPIREVPCNQLENVAAIVEPQDSCDGSVVLASTTFHRTQGQPDEYQATFSVPHAGSICVRIDNGENDGKRVSAAWISIDAPPKDATILAPNDLNQNVERLERRADVETGEHSLNLRLASAPGSALIVEVRFAEVYSEAEVQTFEDLGALQQAACDEWNKRMSLLTAEEAEARRVEQVRLGVGPGDIRVRMNAYGVPRRLEPLPEVDVGQVAGDSPEAVARKWLSHFSGLMGLDDTRISLPLDYVKPSHHGPSRVRLRQHIAGLPVDNAYLEVGVSARNVRRVIGNLVGVPMILSATVPADQAASLASTAAGGLLIASSPVLVVYDLSHLSGAPDSHLAWRVALGMTSPSSALLVWIDAVNGEVLAQQEGAAGASDYVISKGDRVVRTPGDPEPLVPLLDTGEGYDACTGPDEQWCGFAQQTVALLDLELRTDYGRTGWSNDGLAGLNGVPGSEIPPQDDYRIVMDPDRTGGAFWFASPRLEDDAPGLFEFPPRAGRRADGRVVVLDAMSSFATPLLGASPSRDLIRHEFGHGIYQVEVGYRGTVEEAVPPSFRFLWEHAAEYWAIANADDTTPFLTVAQDGAPGRDHSRLTCEVRDSIAHECQAPPLQPLVNDECATYEHMNGFMSNLSLDRLEFDWDHRNACILDKVTTRLFKRSTEFAHGVSTRGLGGEAARFVMYELFSEHSSLTDDILDYASNYRSAVATLAAKCDPVLGTGGSACPLDRNPVSDGIAPLWGVGFYSEAIPMGGISSSIQTRRSPAVAVTANGAHLFFVDLGGRVRVATFDNPIDRTPPIAVDDLTPFLTVPGAITQIAVSPETAGTIMLAYVTDNPTGQNIYVARVQLTPLLVTGLTLSGLAATRAAQDRPAILSGTRFTVVYAAEGSLELIDATEGKAVTPLPRGGSARCGFVPPVEPTRGAGPSLIRDPMFGSVALVYQNRQAEFGFQDFQVISRRRTASGHWCYPIAVDNLEPGGRYGAFPQPSLNGQLRPPQLPQPTFSSGPIAVAYFPPASFLPPVFPRLQVFSTSQPSSTPTRKAPGAPAQLKQLSLGPPLDLPDGANAIYDAETITRNVPIAEAGRDGTATAVFEHPVHGPVLLVYYLGTGMFSTQIFVTYKLSD